MYLQLLFQLIMMFYRYAVFFGLESGDPFISTNNADIPISDIGEDIQGGRPTLTCYTDLSTCCRNSDNNGNGGLGQWTYPDGSLIQNNAGSQAAGEGFYFIRNDANLIRLGRRANVLAPLGSYCCTVPTTAGTMTLCANLGEWIVWVGTGQSAFVPTLILLQFPTNSIHAWLAEHFTAQNKSFSYCVFVFSSCVPPPLTDEWCDLLL